MKTKSSGRGLYGLRVLAASCLGVAILAGCQSSGGSGDGKNPGDSVKPTNAAPARITVSPGGDDSGVDPARTVRVDVADGTLTSVKVVPEDAKTAVRVTGDWGKGKRSWRSDRTMTPGTDYAVQVVATNAAGTRTTHRTSFTTRTAELVNGVTVTPVNKAVVGVGQPVSIQFDHPVEDKKAVERQLSVTTSPKVEGSWGWVRNTQSGHDRVDWRPREYWAKGTEVTMKARLSGVDTGGGRYLRRDVSTSFTIGTERISKVDLENKTMTVFEDGQQVRRILISAGSPSYPTWDGKMVVLGKASSVRMTSASVGITDFYDKTVNWAVHLTTSGTYTHAAPWNAGMFGRVNGSHGCVGMSNEDGKWFFDRSVRGDVVETTGSTRATVPTGNGFGDWNPSYEEWQKLSALR